MVVYSGHALLLATLGGVLVGGAAFLMLHLNGSIMGVSGMFKGSFKGLVDRKPVADWSQKPLFVAGLLLGGLFASYLFPQSMRIWPQTYPLWRIVVGGLLVGSGTALSNGCTSGHGICGLARLSKRSLAAVATFMATGAVIATAASSASAASGSVTGYRSGNGVGWVASLAVGASLLLLASLTPRLDGVVSKDAREYAVVLLSGSAFSIGLAVAAMTDPVVVGSFLDLHPDTWNPTLAFVMIGGLAVNFPLYQWIIRPKVTCGKIDVPSSTIIDVRLIVGASMFGSGWGLAGVCPGPAIVLLPAFDPAEAHLLWVWVALFLCGQLAVVCYDSFLGNRAAKVM